MTKPRHICQSPETCPKCKHAKELREWRLKNKEKIKSYQDEYNKKHYVVNKEKIQEQTNKYFLEHRDYLNQKKRENRAKKSEYYNKIANEYYYENHKEIRAKQKEYYEVNKEIINKKQYQYKKKKYYSDDEFRLKEQISTRIRMALLKGYKSASTETLIGCTISELRVHLEKQFREGMSWENHGVNGWHVDHIVPCASFDLTNPGEQKKCFHYSNLQPLWMLDNIRKGTS